jgi:ribosome-associated protein
MTGPIRIASAIVLPESEIAVSYILGSGPGGQNVNKVATAAQLRFDLMGSPSLPDGLKQRAAKLAGSRLTTGGEIVITASSFRTQAQNREDAIKRLTGLLQQAATPPKRRVPTRPTLASKKRRLETKTKRSSVKRNRVIKPDLD